MPQMMNCKHSGEGWCLDCVQELHEKAVKDRGLLAGLLALIHRDGGHAAERLGFKAATKEAEGIVLSDRVRLDEALAAILDIEQAGHNPADLCPDLIGLPDRYEKLAARLADRANAALVSDAKRKGSYGDASQPQAGAQGGGAVPDERMVRQGWSVSDR